MSDAGTNAVKIGVWTDYSKPRPLGATLTLPNRTAALLLAFLATLVGVTATRSWRLARFLLFHLFAFEKGSAAETQPNPTQVLLRNSETAAGAGVNIAFLLLPWNAKPTPPTKITRKRAAIVLASLCHWILFIAAGLLTSQIFQGRTVVSSVTPTCGVWVGKNESTESVNYGIAAELLLNATLEAEDYVKNCYTRERSTSTILDCGKLHTQTIPVAVQHNATCPFPTGICRYNDQSAYAMDTGKLPFTTLGLNCKRCHELAVRRRTVCAPLREGRLFMGMVGDDAPEGEGTRWVWSFYKNATGGNETYSEEINWTQPGFKLRSMNLAAVGNTSLLQPPLRHPDGYHNPVLVLITVHFGVGFLHKANDPIFSIQGDIEPERLRKPDWPWKYRSNQVLGILGCDELMQYCSLKTGRCTDLKGVIGRRSSEEMDAEYSILAGNTTKDDDAYTGTVVAAVLVDNLLQQSTLQASIFDRDGNAALQAARSLQNDRISAPLPPEQWKIEVDHWFRLAMARLQLGAFATIERRPGVDPARVRNLWKGQRVQDSLCGHIKFNSPGHTSLSFFGVLFVVVGCALILLASFFEVVRETMLRRWLGARMVRWSAAENLALLEEKAG